MSVEIKYVGEDSYHSHDHGNDNTPINLGEGEKTKVSDAKAAQLSDDFPHLFEIGGKAAAAAAPGAKAPTKKELLARAKELDLTIARGATPEEIADAIAEAEGAGGEEDLEDQS